MRVKTTNLERNKQEWSRRKFIGTAGKVGTALVLTSHLLWCIKDIDPRVKPVSQKMKLER